MIELTKGEAESLCDFIEMNLIESIRNDPDCDNLIYVENLLRNCNFEKRCVLIGHLLCDLVLEVIETNADLIREMLEDEDGESN